MAKQSKKKNEKKNPLKNLKTPNLNKKTVVKRAQQKKNGKNKPPAKDFIKTPRNKFQIFDDLDIAQIMAGDPFSSQPFYYVPADDDDPANETGIKMVFGISYEGTIRIASLQKNLIVHSFINQDTEDLYCSVVAVHCKKRNFQILAMGTHEKIIGDRFGKIISLSKAQRNGLRRLLLKQNVVAIFRVWYKEIFKHEPDLNKTVFVDESGAPLTLEDK